VTSAAIIHPGRGQLDGLGHDVVVLRCERRVLAAGRARSGRRAARGAGGTTLLGRAGAAALIGDPEVFPDDMLFL
jgi:hypothetical protein